MSKPLFDDSVLKLIDEKYELNMRPIRFLI